MWVLGHQDDLDADFLAIYGIDLADADLAGPRFFALAHRVTAYTGVMAARVEEQREETGQAPAAAPVAERQPAAARPAPGGDTVSLTAFRFQFPGLVSMANR